MTREEAERLVGQRVRAWTAANGVYVGILKEVLTPSRRPWRGLVKITGVLEPATPFDVTRRVQRKGFRPGQVINVGHSSIERTDRDGTSYLSALRRQLAVFEEYLSGPRPGRWVVPTIRELKLRIAEEEKSP